MTKAAERSWPRRRRVVALVVLVAAVVVTVNVTRHRSSGPPTSPCGAPAGSYRVEGSQIVSSSGKVFVPYGMTVFGLAYPRWAETVKSDDAQINATATAWHGNTVRLQVAPTILLGQSPFDASFLAALEGEVCTAEAAGLNVIISAQYEATSHIAMADAGTAEFWKIVSGIYKHDQHVWFDLFNEPRLFPTTRLTRTPAALWDLWRNGGHGYTGMQALLAAVRAEAPENIVLAQGTEGAQSLTGLPRYELTGQNIVYSIHPYFDDGPEQPSPAAWTRNWGDLSAKIAIIVGEWSEFKSNGHSCVRSAPTLVPEFLNYLTAHRIGLIAWALVRGVLVRGNSLTDPTTFPVDSPFTCSPTQLKFNTEGAGALVMSYFARQARSR